MISLKMYIEKIRKMSIREIVMIAAYLVFITLTMTARVLEKQQVKEKALYDAKGYLAGYVINGEFRKLETRNLPKESEALVAELEDITTKICKGDYMKGLQPVRPEVKIFKAEEDLLEGIVYSKRIPDGVCVTDRENQKSVIYVDEHIYEDKDYFICVYIHEYIHALSNGAVAFDIYEDDERTYSIIKEAYTEHLTNLVIEEGNLVEKYNMKKRFVSVYEDAKKIAAQIDAIKWESGYPIMRSTFLIWDAKNDIYDELGEAYKELNRLAQEEPESEVIPKLLWRLESEYVKSM